MEPSEFQKAFNHSLKLLAIQKRTVRQLYHKLAEKGFEPQIIQSVLQNLCEKNFLNDEEFARVYLADRLQRSPSGKLKIEKDLKRKGLNRDIIQKTLAGLDAAYEFQTALKLAQNKAEFCRDLDSLRRKKKVYDFLVRKGFRFDVCSDVIKQIH